MSYSFDRTGYPQIESGLDSEFQQFGQLLQVMLREILCTEQQPVSLWFGTNLFGQCSESCQLDLNALEDGVKTISAGRDKPNSRSYGKVRVKDPFTGNHIRDLSPRYLIKSDNRLNYLHLIGQFRHLRQQDLSLMIDGKPTQSLKTQFSSGSIMIQVGQVKETLDVTLMRNGHLIDSASVTTIDQPRVLAQRLNLYPDEPVILKGQSLFQQLDTTCSVEQGSNLQVQAQVISSTQLLCPLMLEGTGGLIIYSQSLQQKLNKETPSSIGFQVFSMPQVSSIDPPIMNQRTEMVRLVFDGIVLRRDVRLVWNSVEVKACSHVNSTTLDCPVPQEPQMFNTISLQLFPVAKLSLLKFSVPFKRSPTISRVEPAFVFRSLDNQTVTLMGEDLQDLVSVSVDNGWLLPTTPVTSRQARVVIPHVATHHKSFTFQTGDSQALVMVVDLPEIKAKSSETLSPNQTLFLQMEHLKSFINVVCSMPGQQVTAKYHSSQVLSCQFGSTLLNGTQEVQLKANGVTLRAFDIQFIPQSILSSLSFSTIVSNTPVEIIIAGKWDQVSHKPLVVLKREDLTQKVMFGEYNSNNILVTIPSLEPGDLYTIQLSQSAKLDDLSNPLPLRVVQKPLIGEVSPRFFDDFVTDSYWVEIHSDYFWRDLKSKDITNFRCAVNGELISHQIFSANLLKCLVQPANRTAIYTLAVSVNSGNQWTNVTQFPIRLITLPRLHEIEPTKVAVNINQKLIVKVTRGSMPSLHPLLSISGFKTLSQQAIANDRYELLIEPSADAVVPSSLQIEYANFSKSWPVEQTAVTVTRLQELEYFDGIQLIEVTGQQLQLQPLFCRHNQQIVQLQVQSNYTRGECLLQLIEGLGQEIEVITEFRETIHRVEVDVFKAESMELSGIRVHNQTIFMEGQNLNGSDCLVNETVISGTDVEQGLVSCAIEGLISNRTLFRVQAIKFHGSLNQTSRGIITEVDYLNDVVYQEPGQQADEQQGELLYSDLLAAKYLLSDSFEFVAPQLEVKKCLLRRYNQTEQREPDEVGRCSWNNLYRSVLYQNMMRFGVLLTNGSTVWNQEQAQRLSSLQLSSVQLHDNSTLTFRHNLEKFSELNLTIDDQQCNKSCQIPFESTSMNLTVSHQGQNITIETQIQRPEEHPFLIQTNNSTVQVINQTSQAYYCRYQFSQGITSYQKVNLSQCFVPEQATRLELIDLYGQERSNVLALEAAQEQQQAPQPIITSLDPQLVYKENCQIAQVKVEVRGEHFMPETRFTGLDCNTTSNQTAICDLTQPVCFNNGLENNSSLSVQINGSNSTVELQVESLLPRHKCSNGSFETGSSENHICVYEMNGIKYIGSLPCQVPDNFHGYLSLMTKQGQNVTTEACFYENQTVVEDALRISPSLTVCDRPSLHSSNRLTNYSTKLNETSYEMLIPCTALNLHSNFMSIETIDMLVLPSTLPFTNLELNETQVRFKSNSWMRLVHQIWNINCVTTEQEAPVQLDELGWRCSLEKGRWQVTGTQISLQVGNLGESVALTEVVELSPQQIEITQEVVPSTILEVTLSSPTDATLYQGEGGDSEVAFESNLQIESCFVRDGLSSFPIRLQVSGNQTRGSCSLQDVRISQTTATIEVWSADNQTRSFFYQVIQPVEVFDVPDLIYNPYFSASSLVQTVDLAINSSVTLSIESQQASVRLIHQSHEALRLRIDMRRATNETIEVQLVHKSRVLKTVRFSVVQGSHLRSISPKYWIGSEGQVQLTVDGQAEFCIIGKVASRLASNGTCSFDLAYGSYQVSLGTVRSGKIQIISNSQWLFVQQAQITRVNPRLVSSYGAQINVTGSSFNSFTQLPSQIKCLFQPQNLTSDINIVSDTLIQCHAPNQHFSNSSVSRVTLTAKDDQTRLELPYLRFKYFRLPSISQVNHTESGVILSLTERVERMMVQTSVEQVSCSLIRTEALCDFEKETFNNLTWIDLSFDLGETWPVQTVIEGRRALTEVNGQVFESSNLPEPQFETTCEANQLNTGDTCLTIEETEYQRQQNELASQNLTSLTLTEIIIQTQNLSISNPEANQIFIDLEKTTDQATPYFLVPGDLPVLLPGQALVLQTFNSSSEQVVNYTLDGIQMSSTLQALGIYHTLEVNPTTYKLQFFETPLQRFPLILSPQTHETRLINGTQKYVTILQVADTRPHAQILCAFLYGVKEFHEEVTYGNSSITCQIPLESIGTDYIAKGRVAYQAKELYFGGAFEVDLTPPVANRTIRTIQDAVDYAQSFKLATNETLGYNISTTQTCVLSNQSTCEDETQFEAPAAIYESTYIDLHRTLLIRGQSLKNTTCLFVINSQTNYSTELKAFRSGHEATCLIPNELWILPRGQELTLQIDGLSQPIQVFKQLSMNASPESIFLKTESQVHNLSVSDQINQSMTYCQYLVTSNLTHTQNITFASRVQVNRGVVSCRAPMFYEDTQLIYLRLRVEQEDQIVEYSNAISLVILQRPQIRSVHPATVPVNTASVIKLAGDQDIYSNFTLQFSSILDPILLKLSQSGELQFEFPSLPQADFHTFQIVYQNISWPTNLGVETLQLPKLMTLVPNYLPSYPKLTQVSTSVIAVGSNFTNYTECVIDGAIVQTRWLSAQTVECKVTQAKRAGETMQIQLLQRELYYSLETRTLYFRQQSYVSEVTPSIMMTGRVGSILNVTIVDTNSTVRDLDRMQTWCKFDNYTVRASSIKRIEDTPIDKFAKMDWIVLPQISKLLVQCRIPRLYQAKTYQIEVMTSRESTFSYNSLNSSLTLVERPKFYSIDPPLAPDDFHINNMVTVSGDHFTSFFNYSCIFQSTNRNELYQTEGSLLSQQAVTCQVPNITLDKLEFLRMNLEIYWADPHLFTNRNLTLPGSARFMVYNMPQFTRFQPSLGSTQTETTVRIQGSAIQLGLAHEIKCRFGSAEVTALVIKVEEEIECQSPLQVASEYNLGVSIDGGRYYFQVGTYVQIAEPVFNSSQANISPAVIGKDTIQNLTISGQGFPDSSILSEGYPICRFNFSGTAVSRISVQAPGRVISTQEMLCQSIQGSVDSSVTVEVSFNGQQFFTVETSEPLQFVERPSIIAIRPPFGFSEGQINMQVEGLRLHSASQVGYTGLNQDTVSMAEQAIDKSITDDTNLIVPGQEYYNVSRVNYDGMVYGAKMTEMQVYKTPAINYSDDQIAFRYIERPTLISIEPFLVSGKKGGEIFLNGYGFFNTTLMRCKAGPYWSNETHFVSPMRIRCIFPEVIVPYGNVQSFSLSLNGEELQMVDQNGTNLELIVSEEPFIYDLTPTVIFSTDKNIVLNVKARGLVQSNSLRCKVGQTTLPGEFYYDEEAFETSIRCSVPSYDYLIFSALIQSIPQFISVEISNDGYKYTEQNFQIIFIKSSTGVKEVSPVMGYELGGTVVNITTDVIPTINGTLPNLTCEFPGNITVLSTYVSDTITECITPPLNTSLTEYISFNHTSFFFTPVNLLLRGKTAATFYFLYLEQVKVLSIEPPNIVPPNPDVLDSSLIPTDYEVFILGQSFLASYDNWIRCKVVVADNSNEVEIVATYINNHTLSCMVPMATIQEKYAMIGANDLDIPMRIEVSMNGGQQYTDTTDPVSMIKLRQEDRLNATGKYNESTAIYPDFSYARGGTLTYINYTIAYQPESPRARCVFVSGDPTQGPSAYTYQSVPIVEHIAETQSLSCFSPPVYLVNSSMAGVGGVVKVYLSTNGFDLSSNYAFYTYLPSPVITNLIPSWVLSNRNQTIQVEGQYFFNALSEKAQRIARVNSTQNDGFTRNYTLNFISENLLTFEFPADVFEPGDQMTLEITLEGFIFLTAPQTMYVYEKVVLGNVRPKLVHQPDVNGTSKILFVETVTDVYDMEMVDLLRCRFQSKPLANESQTVDASLVYCPGCDEVNCSCTEAKFLNRSTLYCPIPRFEDPGTIEVDITIVGGVDFSEPQNGIIQYITVIDPPQNPVINNTQAYETLLEQVFLGVNGTGWNASQIIVVKIGDDTRLVTGESVLADDNVTSIPRLVIPVPIGYAAGTYPIEVSVDGGMTFYGAQNGWQMTLVVDSCPEGKTCSSKVASDCQPGFFCPQIGTFELVKCPLGTHQESNGTAQCTTCPQGMFCDVRGMPYKGVCPHGYVCNTDQLGSVNQMEPCPAGFYCPFNGTPTLCPDGHYCPAGTGQLDYWPGNFSTPQPCSDGMRCQNSTYASVLSYADPNITHSRHGARSPSGNDACAAGTFCKDGVAKDCPPGSSCNTHSLLQQQQCRPGTFTDVTGQSYCGLCPPGTFCYYANQSIPYQCKPGAVCAYGGLSSSSSACPAGSYCEKAVASTISNSTAQDEFKPALCYQGTYCLQGVRTPIVDASNPQAAQACIAGTFCGEGSKSPEGKGKCLPGYYCPPNVAEALPAPKGSHCPGAGNSEPKMCLSGFYQDETAQAECKQCPKGFYCPIQNMEAAYQCAAGSYTRFVESIKCTKCPQGTFSDEVMLEREELCQSCKEGFVCDDAGMREMFNETFKTTTNDCDKGFLCTARTTQTTMRANPCPSGYYTRPRAPKLGYGYLCRAGRFCPPGTGHLLSDQSECLPGFFCPEGTAAQKTLDGEFAEGIKMEPRSYLISLIVDLIKELEEYLDVNDIRMFVVKYERHKRKHDGLALNKTGQISLEELDLEYRTYRKWEWRNFTWHWKNETLYERKAYLEQINVTVECEADKGLPKELIDLYFQGGLQLKCPMGTTSQSGAKCLGQCKKPKAQREPISILNPVDASSLSQSILDMAKDDKIYGNQESRVLKEATKPKRRIIKKKKRNRALQQYLNKQGPKPQADSKATNGSKQNQNQTAKGNQTRPLNETSKGNQTKLDNSTGTNQTQQNVSSQSNETTQEPQQTVVPKTEDDEAELESKVDIWAERFDTPRLFKLQPLEIAKITLDFRGVPPGFEYNEHYAIVVLGRADDAPKDLSAVEKEAWQKKYEPDQDQQQLPDYFSGKNDRIASEENPGEMQGTVKRAQLELKIFNHQEYEIEFRVAIYLFHGLFLPYLARLQNKVNLEIFSAQRQLWGTTNTWAIMVAEIQTGGITLPYNTPNLGEEPLFYMDMTSTAEGVNKGTKGMKGDPYDGTFWDSKQVNAVVMSWLPYFSNCEGYDTRIILFDVFEQAKSCELPAYEDISIVSPIPLTGLDPVSDKCAPTPQYPEYICRYDEPLDEPSEESTRWYELEEDRELFFISRLPVAIEKFKEESEISEGQSVYITSILDGTDDLIQATFRPDPDRPTSESKDGPLYIPTLVEANFFYYQRTTDEKLMSRVDVWLKEYKLWEGGDPQYKLRITYQALSYFALINTFEFELPIYFLLFLMVSLVIMLVIMLFWVLNLTISTYQTPPFIRFTHMVRVTFIPPLYGAGLAFVPILLIAVMLYIMNGAYVMGELDAQWVNVPLEAGGYEVELADKIINNRGRCGLLLTIISIVILLFGSENLIYKPNDDQAEEYQERRKAMLAAKAAETSHGGQEEGQEQKEEVGPEEEDGEDETNVQRAFDWKQRHFWVTCMFVSLFLLVKLEFSYSVFFSKNLMMFLLIFQVGDIVMEQLLLRVFMSEALLIQPIVASMAVIQFIITMGAEDFSTFVSAYFLQTSMMILCRAYIGPWIEILEHMLQDLIVWLANRDGFIGETTKKLFKRFLVFHLNDQIQRIQLVEYKQSAKLKDAFNVERDKSKMFNTSSDGSEALLASVAAYSAQIQALFQVPIFIIYCQLFVNETKVAYGLRMKQNDIKFYLLFTVMIIPPILISNLFMLHILETVHGYKIFDYFTYCDYRFRIRKESWVKGQELDRSIQMTWRSLDSMGFTSQFHFITCLTTCGILMMTLGVTTMIRNDYNPFAEPLLIMYSALVKYFSAPLLIHGLTKVAKFFGVWQVQQEEAQKIDVSAYNRLDRANNAKKLAKIIQENNFRHKFIRVNREWIIHNIANILGGKNYLKHAGVELPYLQAIYQRAVNAQAIEKKLESEQKKVQNDLAMMPYNLRAHNPGGGKPQNVADEDLQITDDSVSDIPAPRWYAKEGLTRQYLRKIARMWLGFARQQLRLKSLVSDIVARQLKANCQRCRSIYRLQVIQKIGFTQICQKFRKQNQGFAFSIQKWRKFYSRHQIFITQCMECAYIDNLNAAHILEQDGDLQRLMAENALKNVGAHDQYVAQRLKLPHVRKIIKKWILDAKSSLLHKRSEKEEALRKAYLVLKEKMERQQAMKDGRDYDEEMLELKKQQSSLLSETPKESQATDEIQTNSLTISSVALA